MIKVLSYSLGGITMCQKTTYQNVSTITDFNTFNRFYNNTLMRSKNTIYYVLIDVENYDALKLFHDSKNFEEIEKYFKNHLLDLNIKPLIISQYNPKQFILALEKESEIKTLNNHLKALNHLFQTPNIQSKVTVFAGVYSTDIKKLDIHTLIKTLLFTLYMKNLIYEYISVYTKELQSAIQYNTEIVDALLNIISGNANQLMVQYQPIVDVDTQKIVSFEALIRLKLNNGNIISPLDFVPLAEKYNTMTLLSPYIFDKTMEGFYQLLKKYPSATLSLNISAQQFKSNEIIKKLKFISKKYNLKPNQIDLELTETLLSLGNASIKEKLKTLKQEGYHLCIDDFGTGFSNLATLIELPIDTIKIDRSFTKYYNYSPDYKNFLTGLIFTLKSIDKTIIIEGIETKAQLNFFKEKAIEKAQGFYISKPLNVDEFL